MTTESGGLTPSGIEFTPIHHALKVGPVPLSTDLIEKAVANRVPEAADLDWKRDNYDPNNPKWQQEATKDMAAMANSGGGWIVLGVADVDDRADEIVGVDWTSRHEQRLRKVAHDRVFPPLRNIEFSRLDTQGGLTVVALHVAPDGHLHFISPDPHTFKVPYRNGPDTEFYGAREAGAALLAYANGGKASDYFTGMPNSSSVLPSSNTLGDLDVELATLVATIRAMPVCADDVDSDAPFETLHDSYLEASAPVVRLAVESIWQRVDCQTDQQLVDALQRLLSAGGKEVLGTPYHRYLLNLRLLPALLVLMGAGIACTVRGQESLFLRLATEPTAREHRVGTRLPAFEVLHPQRVLREDEVNSMPRWGGSRWTYPASHLLKADLRTLFQGLLDDEEFADAFHGVEYRLSLLQGLDALAGEYVGERGWTWQSPSIPLAEADFRAAERRAGTWPWTERLGGEARYDDTLVTHRDVLAGYKYHRMR